MATELTARQAYLIRDLAKGQSRYNLLERYYDGDAPLPEGAEGASKAYRRFQKKARMNIGQLAVAATRERMIIGGFRTGADGDENGDLVARRLWKANNLDVLSADIHNMMLATIRQGPGRFWGWWGSESLLSRLRIHDRSKRNIPPSTHEF